MTFLGDTQQVKDLDRRGKGEEKGIWEKDNGERRREEGEGKKGRREKGEGRREEEGGERKEERGSRREEREEEEGGKRGEAKRKKSTFTEYVSHTHKTCTYTRFPNVQVGELMHSLHSSKQDQPHAPP